MKKSLVAMALMFGAVVCFSACGGDDNKTDDPVVETCKVYVSVGGQKVPSLDYPTAVNKPWTAPGALGTQDAAVTTNKGGSYICE
jgi:hypothetical protein